MKLAKKISPGIMKHVEEELKNFHETKHELVKLRNEIILSSPQKDETGIRGNLPSDPTGRVVSILSTDRRIKHYEETIYAIQGVYDSLEEPKKKMIRLRYWMRPERLNWDAVAKRVNVGEATVYRWRDEIVLAIAEKLGWG